MRKHFATQYSKEEWMKLYKRGKTQLYTRQYFSIPNRTRLWLAIHVKLIKDPVSNELYVFFYAYSLRYKREYKQYLSSNVGKDNSKHTLNVENFRDVAKHLLESFRDKMKCTALAYIDIHGTQTSDFLLPKELEILYRHIYLLSKDDFLIGLEKGNRLVLLCENAFNEAWVVNRLEQIIEMIRKINTSDDGANTLSISAYVSTQSSATANYTFMLAQAYAIFEICDSSQNDKAVYSKDSLPKEERNHMELFSKINLKELNLFQKLNEVEQEIFSNFALDIISSNNKESCCYDTLRQLGQYYRADRVHLLKILSNRELIECIHDWTSLHKFSVKNSYKNKRIEDIPTIKSVVNKQEPVFLGTNNTQDTVTGEKKWRYIAIPIINDAMVSGVLTVENPSVNFENVNLLSAVSYIFSIIGLMQNRISMNPFVQKESYNEMISLLQKNLDSTKLTKKSKQEMSLAFLNHELHRGDYILYLQPQFDLHTGQLVGAEGLVRKRGKYNILTPQHFIPDLESSGIINVLDYYIFEQSLKLLQLWHRQGRKRISISTNFSRDTLLSPNAIATIIAIHSNYDVPPEDIMIEITETIGKYDNHTVSEMIQALQHYGFKVSLDDFGSAYANLSLLTACNFNEIKIDKTITDTTETNNVSQALVESVARICNDSGAICIAEGVETEEQAMILKKLGCDRVQGYHFGKPVDIKTFEKNYYRRDYDESE